MVSPTADATTQSTPLGIAGLATTPKRPHAGKRFTVRVRLRTPGASLRVRCLATAGKVRAPVLRRSASAGAVRCSWLVPARAAGRTLRALVEVKAGGEIVQRRLSRRIRP